MKVQGLISEVQSEASAVSIQQLNNAIAQSEAMLSIANKEWAIVENELSEISHPIHMLSEKYLKNQELKGKREYLKSKRESLDLLIDELKWQITLRS